MFNLTLRQNGKFFKNSPAWEAKIVTHDEVKPGDPGPAGGAKKKVRGRVYRPSPSEGGLSDEGRFFTWPDHRGRGRHRDP